MPNQITDVNFQSPYGVDQAEIQRRQALAQMLQQQGMQAPQPQQTGRFAVQTSPLEYMGKLLQQVGGAAMQGSSQGDQAKLSQRMQQDRQQALAQALQASAGSPQPDAAQGGGPAQPPNPAAGMAALAQSPDPTLMQQFAPLMNMQQAQYKQQQDQTFKASQFQQTEQDRLQREAAARQQQADMARLTASLKQGAPERPYFTPQPTAEGVYAFNNRTGQMELVKDKSGKAIIPAKADVPLASALHESSEGGKKLADYSTTIMEDAAKSAVANRMLDNMEAASKDFKLGKIAPAQSALVQWAQAVGVPLTDEDKKSAGSIQALNSMAIKMAGTATRQSDAQPSQLQYFNILKSMPNIERSPEGFKAITGYMRDMNNYNIAKHGELVKWKSAHNGSAAGFEAEWPNVSQQLPLVWNKPPPAGLQGGQGAGGGGGLTPQEQQELQQLRQRFGRGR